jgi:hypothetical protein
MKDGPPMTHGSFFYGSNIRVSSDLYKKCPSDDSPAYQKANLLQVNWWQQKKPCPDPQAGTLSPTGTKVITD